MNTTVLEVYKSTITETPFTWEAEDARNAEGEAVILL